MARIPDRLDIDKADRKLYDHNALTNEILVNRTRKEQFLFTMAIGFKNQVKRTLDAREGFFLAKDMRSEDEALMNCIALYDTGSADILSDREAVYRIAEEYAHAGIKLLYDKAKSTQPGTYFKKLEVELFALLDTLDSE